MDLEILNQYWLLILIAAAWDLAWKSMALWSAARAGDKLWYIIILVVNSIGILPILYLLLNKDKVAKPTP